MKIFDKNNILFCSETPASCPSIESVSDEHSAHFWFKELQLKYGERSWNPIKAQQSMNKENALKQVKIFGEDRMIENRKLCENIDSGSDILACISVDHFEACDPRKEKLLKNELSRWKPPIIWVVAQVSILIYLTYTIIIIYY